MAGGCTRRRDPKDGREYSLQELGVKFAGAYVPAGLRKYWLETCTPTTPSKQKLVLVVRHGEAQHNVKNAMKKGKKPFDPLIGPVLTDRGREQAAGARHNVAATLATVDAGAGGALVVTSNLVRAVETACFAVPSQEVLVQPLLRERIAQDCDQPSQLEALQEWAARSGQQLQLDAYESVLADAGGHDAYLQSCWANDCVRGANGQWTDRENKDCILARAAEMTAWLESLEHSVVVVVGHSVFLTKLTGDTSHLENGELRLYNLARGSWSRVRGAPTTLPSQAQPRAQGAAGTAPVLGAVPSWAAPPVSAPAFGAVRSENSTLSQLRAAASPYLLSNPRSMASSGLAQPTAASMFSATIRSRYGRGGPGSGELQGSAAAHESPLVFQPPIRPAIGFTPNAQYFRPSAAPNSLNCGQ